MKFEWKIIRKDSGREVWQVSMIVMICCENKIWKKFKNLK